MPHLACPLFLQKTKMYAPPHFCRNRVSDCVWCVGAHAPPIFFVKSFCTPLKIPGSAPELASGSYFNLYQFCIWVLWVYYKSCPEGLEVIWNDAEALFCFQFHVSIKEINFSIVYPFFFQYALFVLLTKPKYWNLCLIKRGPKATY